MTPFILLTLAATATVLAQDAHKTPSWEYKGCSQIDPACFTQPMQLPNGRITPEACQAACVGYQFAALLNEECRCGNDANGIYPTDESLCDHCCMNDQSLGGCGNSCPAEHPNIANVYQRQPAAQQYGSVTQPTSAPLTPAGEPCSTESAEATMSVPSPAATQASSKVHASESCPPSSPPPYQPPQGSAPEAKTVASSTSVPSQPPTTFSSAASSATPYPELTPAYQTTPMPASSDAYGTPPVPSQIPAGSGATLIVPSFSVMGGLLFVAAFVL